MNVSIIIPHYAVGKMTAFSISQLLKHKGDHNVEIVVIDNKYSDNSCKYLLPFRNDIVFAPYPGDRLQSHGIAISYALDRGLVSNEWFITMENDAFPIREHFIDYYENLINEGYDAAGSLLKLSGGEYLHGCGALYSQSLYLEAKKYCNSIPYTYFPNMAVKSGFDSHLMIPDSLLSKVIDNPEDWIELSEGYKGLSRDQMLAKAEYYSATNTPFHCGMGGLQEDVNTYGLRCIELDSPHIILKNNKTIIFRVGYEPSQWLSYFMEAKRKKIFYIPTEIKWMPNRQQQQQEYTINEAGIKHLWAISSYTERGSKDVEDIYEAKRRLPDNLYETLPEHQKIKINA